MIKILRLLKVKYYIRDIRFRAKYYYFIRLGRERGKGR